MHQPKTREVREKELQALIATPEGRAELERLASRYEEAGRRRSMRSSVITYILVHEREKGLIAG
jgi:hypothetical protein